MLLRHFLRIVDEVLASRGYPVSIHDLPDQNFHNWFDDEFTFEEAMDSAKEFVDDMIASGDLPDYADLASVELPDLADL